MAIDTVGIKFKEKLSRRLRRYAMRLVTTQHRRIVQLADIASKVYDTVYDPDFDGCQIAVSGQLMIVLDASAETVYAAVSFEILGKQSLLMVDEDNDRIGIGRAIKKMLDAQGFHVYYENIPLAYAQGIVAIGASAVTSLNLIKYSTDSNNNHYEITSAARQLLN